MLTLLQIPLILIRLLLFVSFIFIAIIGCFYVYLWSKCDPSILQNEIV
jgi:drug/metabolite transporter superfamily protein YnfA